MSLFEESGFQYRETCFVLFDKKNRPTMDQVAEVMRALGERYEVTDREADVEEALDALSIRCPYDHSAMDISYVEGEDVQDQLNEMENEIALDGLPDEDKEKWARLKSFDARFDVFHFEELTPDGDPDEGLMDPGAMLVVLQTLARLTQGVGIDAQSGTLI